MKTINLPDRIEVVTKFEFNNKEIQEYIKRNGTPPINGLNIRYPDECLQLELTDRFHENPKGSAGIKFNSPLEFQSPIKLIFNKKLCNSKELDDYQKEIEIFFSGLTEGKFKLCSAVVDISKWIENVPQS